jgi:hypothetical protein
MGERVIRYGVEGAYSEWGGTETAFAAAFAAWLAGPDAPRAQLYGRLIDLQHARTKEPTLLQEYAEWVAGHVFEALAATSRNPPE